MLKGYFRRVEAEVPCVCVVSVLHQSAAPPGQLGSAGNNTMLRREQNFIRGRAELRRARDSGAFLCAYLIVPASSGLNAYSQSFMSLSLLACRRIPLCFVHTANVLGVWK